jgi:glycosyltransferase involved in cell wall biosynthesis
MLAGEKANKPFVLMVGTIEPRKNHLLAYRVWRRLIERHGEKAPRLMIAGGEGWLTGDLRYQITHDPLTRDRVVMLGRVSNAELGWLYRNCLFTVFPSIYEGWGLPVAESLMHGKYCITSNVSSLPEIGGELVGYHDPIDAMRMLQLVEEAAFDAPLRERREKAIQSCYVGTTWAQAATLLLETLNQICSSSVRDHTEAA